jgi:alanine transaminase
MMRVSPRTNRIVPSLRHLPGTVSSAVPAPPAVPVPAAMAPAPVSAAAVAARRAAAGLRRGLAVSSSAPVAATPARCPYQRVLVAGGGINRNLEAMQYAVRGELVLRAEALADRLDATRAAAAKARPGAHLDASAVPPFDRVTYCNIGNPQSVGQHPITFMRQVLAAVVCPDLLLENAAVAAVLPVDVVARAREILASCHGVGAYSESRGIPSIRRDVAAALEARDNGAPADPENIFLTNGASEGVKVLLSLLIRDSRDGVLIPTPQYPLYSATMQSLGGTQVGYHLNEHDCWSLSVDELEKSLQRAITAGTSVRALCVINPGNPTGQVLSRDNIELVVRFCERHNLVLMADEVYQKNVYCVPGSSNDVGPLPFVSFKRVVHELGSPIELASFHSVSKGVTGECGLRGGFVELHNMDPHAHDMTYKTLSVSLCANIPGQIAVGLMMRPPSPGDPSYALFEQETRSTFESLRRKGQKLAAGLNTFEGVACNPPQGAMYLFPRISIPVAAVQLAAKKGLASPDVLYCLELLDATGICVVPGSGFGQSPGTFHFRTTFLPPEDQIDDVIVKMRDFHHGFLAKYGGLERITGKQ